MVCFCSREERKLVNNFHTSNSKLSVVPAISQNEISGQCWSLPTVGFQSPGCFQSRRPILPSRRQFAHCTKPCARVLCLMSRKVTICKLQIIKSVRQFTLAWPLCTIEFGFSHSYSWCDVVKFLKFPTVCHPSELRLPLSFADCTNWSILHFHSATDEPHLSGVCNGKGRHPSILLPKTVLLVNFGNDGFCSNKAILGLDSHVHWVVH